MKRKKYVVSALAAALAFGTFAGIGNDSIYNPISTAYAADFPLQETSTKLVIHKLSYDLKEGEEKPVIDNKRGKELDKLPEGVSKFDKSLYGDVTFTLYKLTNNEGKDVLVEDFKGAVVSDDKTTVTIGEDTFKLVKIEDRDIDADGKAEFSKQGNGSYLISETSANKNLVGEKEQDQLFSLPLANDTGTGFLDTLHLYPKNDVQNITFEFTKYLDQKGVGHELEGIEFEIYKGEPGKGELYSKDMTVKTDKEGKIHIEGMPVGDYYLVEKNPKANTTAYYAQNDENNILKFSVGKLSKDDSTAEFINYTEPNAEKIVNDGRYDASVERDENGVYKNNERHDFTIGDLVPFTHTLDVKGDIMGGEVIKVGDKTVIKKPYSKFRAYDNPADEKLIIPKGEGSLSERLNLKVSIDDTELKEGVDYKVSEHEDGFMVDFITRDVPYTDIDGNKSTVKAVSETVANTFKKDGTSKIKINYNYELTTKSLSDEYIENELRFVYNNHPSDSEEFDKEIIDKANVITYGKRFKKTTRKANGFLADDSVKIPGAKFYVYREVDGAREYLTEVNGKRAFKKSDTPLKENLVLESDQNGEFEIVGLKEGEYFIEEFEAPLGYRLNNKALKFSVKKGSYDGEGSKVDHFENVRDGMLPITGDDVLKFYVFAGGIALMGAVFHVNRSRKEKAEA